jgi:PIN domain nuclease of toxin-antitoxin system
MILLDTHVLVWSQLEPRKLSRAATSALQRAERGGGAAISVITLVELASLFVRGRVDYSGNIETSIQEYNTANLIVLPDYAWYRRADCSLPSRFPLRSHGPHHRRQYSRRGMPLVTADERMQTSPLVETIW